MDLLVTGETLRIRFKIEKYVYETLFSCFSTYSSLRWAGGRLGVGRGLGVGVPSPKEVLLKGKALYG